MMLHKELQRIGLTANEAKLYLAALELGETNISRLAKKAGVKRTTAYLIAESLKDRGLLNTSKKRKRNNYFAEDPRALLEQLDERKMILSGFLPQLLSISNLIDKKPLIRFYESEDGIREIYKDTLRFQGQEILTFYSDTQFADMGEEFFYSFYIPQRIAKRISARAIVPRTNVMQSFAANNRAHLRRTKLVDPKIFSLPIEIMIYGGRRVAIISTKEQIGLVIESAEIFNGMRAIFETIWALEPSEEV